MKSKKYFLLSLIFLIVSAENALAQEGLTEDPLLNFKHFYEMSIGVNTTRVNTNNTIFDTPNGQYNFIKNNYLPSFDATFNYGWLFKDTETKEIYSLKTGLNIVSRSANLKDSSQNDLQLQTAYLQIPVQFGYRFPLRYNAIKNNFYRAFEFNFGFYAAIPFSQKLDVKDNIDSRAESTFGNYIKFGAITEIAFSSLNQKGNGHKFGFRFSSDFTSILKLKDTKYGLYPYYVNLGLFYNLSNKYK